MIFMKFFDILYVEQEDVFIKAFLIIFMLFSLVKSKINNIY